MKKKIFVFADGGARGNDGGDPSNFCGPRARRREDGDGRPISPALQRASPD